MTILNLYRRIKTSSLSNDFLIIVFIFIFLTIVIASCFSFYLYQDQSQQNIAVLNLRIYILDKPDLKRLFGFIGF